MITINEYIQFSSHMASMFINDRPLVKQIMLIGLSSDKLLHFGVNVVHLQTTTTLLAAFSAGTKTNFLWILGPLSSNF